MPRRRPHLPLMVLLLLLLPSLPVPSQTDPPPLGQGNWVIADTTVVSNTSLVMNGTIIVQPGALLVLDNVSVRFTGFGVTQFRRGCDGDIGSSTFGAGTGIVVRGGGALHLINGTALATGEVGKYFPVRVERGGLLWMEAGSMDNLLGVLLEGNAAVDNSSFADNDLGFIVYGNLTVSNSTFGLSGPDYNAESASIRALDGKTVIRNSKFTEWWGYGVFADGRRGGAPDVEISGSNFTGAYHAQVISIQANTVIRNSTFRDGFAGVQAVGGRVSVEDSTFERTVFGFYTGGYDLPGRCGMYYLPTTVSLRNGRFLDQWIYGISRYAEDFGNELKNSRVEWNVSGGAVVENSTLMMNGFATVTGTLDLRSANITFESGDIPGALGAVVRRGGLLRSSDTLFNGEAGGFSLAVEDGGRADFERSLFVAGGNARGDPFDPDAPALHARDGGTVTVSSTEFRRCRNGLGASGTAAVTLEGLLFNYSTAGLAVNGSAPVLRNSTFVSQAPQTDISLTGNSYLRLVNTTHATTFYGDAASTLDAAWYLDAKVRVESGWPVAGAVVELFDRSGGRVAGGATDARGMLPGMVVSEYTETRSGHSDRTPHTATASKGGSTGSAAVDLRGNSQVEILLRDTAPPALAVASPRQGAALNSSPVAVNGTAGDNLFLRSVEFSPDNRTWIPVTLRWDQEPFSASWSVEVGWAVEGNNTVFFRAADGSGNWNLTRLDFVLDTGIPSLAILRPVNGSYTNSSAVEVRGLTEPGSAVALESPAWNGTGTADASGMFSLYGTLPDGRHDISVRVSDRAGNRASAGVTVTVDTVPPPLAVDSPQDGTLLGAHSVTVRGRGETGTPVSARVWPSGDSGTAAPGEDGGFAFLLNLSEGENTVTLTATDRAGNPNTASVHVRADTTAPAIRIAIPENSTVTRALRMEVSGDVDEDANVTVGGHETPVTSRRFNATVDLTVEGRNALVVEARDRAGNSARAVVFVIRDTVPPALSIEAPRNGTATAAEFVIVTGTTEAGAALMVGNRSVPVGKDGSFIQKVPLVPGKNFIVITAADRAGNNASAEINVTYALPKWPGEVLGARIFEWWWPLGAILATAAVIAVQGYIFDRRMRRKDEGEDEG